jgi:hypothetical protein
LYQHLDYEEWVLTQSQLTLGFKPTAIAPELGRSPWAVGRRLEPGNALWAVALDSVT